LKHLVAICLVFVSGTLTGGTFMVVLIGKDGGEKLRREEGATLGEIFGLIDTMPMRRREMRGKTDR